MVDILKRGLARSREIKHPLGTSVRTPLLVPAFSTKGFRVKKGKSEIREYMKWAAQVLEESFLVSAYDVHYHNLPAHRNLPNTRLVFLDSGGYETSTAHDLSAAFQHPCEAEPWDIERLQEVVTSWPKKLPTVFVSYDHGQHCVSLKTQIRDAHRLFGHLPRQLHEFIVKPEPKSKGYIDCDAVCAYVGKFADYHILGVTEKELGNSLRDRILKLARIRRALDTANIDIPLHVFGSLDPITSTLYFLAGAEIFDGLTWLRYGYLEASSLYYQTYAVLEESLSMSWDDDTTRGYMVLHNLSYLTCLRDQMVAYLSDGSIEKLEPRLRVCAQQARDVLEAEMGGNT